MTPAQRSQPARRQQQRSVGSAAAIGLGDSWNVGKKQAKRPRAMCIRGPAERRAEGPPHSSQSDWGLGAGANADGLACFLMNAIVSAKTSSLS